MTKTKVCNNKGGNKQPILRNKHYTEVYKMYEALINYCYRKSTMVLY